MTYPGIMRVCGSIISSEHWGNAGIRTIEDGNPLSLRSRPENLTKSFSKSFVIAKLGELVWVKLQTCKNNPSLLQEFKLAFQSLKRLQRYIQNRNC